MDRARSGLSVGFKLKDIDIPKNPYCRSLGEEVENLCEDEPDDTKSDVPRKKGQKCGRFCRPTPVPRAEIVKRSRRKQQCQGAQRTRATRWRTLKELGDTVMLNSLGAAQVLVAGGIYVNTETIETGVSRQTLSILSNTNTHRD